MLEILGVVVAFVLLDRLASWMVANTPTEQGDTIWK